MPLTAPNTPRQPSKDYNFSLKPITTVTTTSFISFFLLPHYFRSLAIKTISSSPRETLKYRINMWNLRAKAISIEHVPQENTPNPLSPAEAVTSQCVAARKEGGPLCHFEQLLENNHKHTILGILHECVGVIEDSIHQNDTSREEDKNESWPALWARIWKLVKFTEEFRKIFLKGVLVIYVQMIIAVWKQSVPLSVAESTDFSIVLGLVLYATRGELMRLLGYRVKFYLLKSFNWTVYVKGFNNPNAPFFNTPIFYAALSITIHFLVGRFDSIYWQASNFVYWYYENAVFAVVTLLGWLLGKKLIGYLLGALDGFH
ncbi:hypothetical protein DFP73DRAFT_597959 [Morchella snyderi]|nr:hypothetical protein DFP73DRAFT_597959 [Morchella snyderi]